MKGPTLPTTNEAVAGRREQRARPVGPVVVLKCGAVYSRMHPGELLYVEVQGNYVELHLTTRRVVLRASLTEVLHALPEGFMVRINRAQAVNILRLDRVGTDEVTVGDRSLSLSARYRDELMGRLKVVSDR